MTGDARPDRDLILPVHLLFVALLGVATIVLFAIPTGASDCCVPIAIFGVFTLGELVAILIGIAVAGVTGRHSPLVAVDAIVTAPLVALVPGAFSSSGAVLPLAVGLLVVGLASAILAARVVREQGSERIVLAAALILMGAFWLAVPATTIVPIAVLAALLWPHVERSRPDADEPAAPPRPAAPMVGRGGAPDAAAVLARRRPEPSAPPSAPPPNDPPSDARPPDPT